MNYKNINNENKDISNEKLDYEDIKIEYFDIPINIEKIKEDLIISQDKIKELLKNIHAAINYAENYLGYTLCSQYIIRSYKTNNQKKLIINTKKYQNSKVISENIPIEQYIIKENEIILNNLEKVSEVIIKHTIVKKHINPFIEQVIETHAIESFTNCLLYTSDAADDP